MAKQVQVFIRMLLVGILALGANAQFAATAQTITMTTAKKVGSRIYLSIIAEGDVTIKGATGVFSPINKVEYTLTEQTVTIEGKVTLLICADNQLTSIDVSKNTGLTGLNCSSNQLTELDLSKNTALTLLYCSDNKLKSLDISERTGLTRLYCSDNQLTTLDVSKNTALTMIRCWTNQLTTLDVSNCAALEALHCYGNQLTTLDLSKNTALILLGCHDNRLTNLDMSKNTALAFLYCYTNQIKGEAMTRLVKSLPKPQREQSEFCVIDTKNAKEQNTCTKADVAIAKGKGWKVTDHNGKWDDRKDYAGSEEAAQENVITMMTTKKIGEKIKLGIDAEGAVNIEGVTGTFVNEEILSYTLTKQTITIKGRVTALYCTANQITNLDVSKNTALTGLYCSANQLTKLDVSTNTALESLYCSSNQLTNLDVSKSTALTLLYCFSNQIKGAAMTSLVKSLPTCEKGEFCVIDTKNANEGNVCTKTQAAIAKDKGWRVSDFNGSWLDRKDYAGSEEEAQKNIITMTSTKKVGDRIRLTIKAEGDVSIEGATGSFINGGSVEYSLTKQTLTITGKVTELTCSFMQLTKLDVSKSTALTKLSCPFNLLTTLDVSKNVALTELNCAFNKFTNSNLDVSKNVALTKLNCTFNKFTNLDVSKNTLLTYLACTSNQLTSLDVSKNTLLTYLACTSNQLTSLDVSKNTALISLLCSLNQLTSLDVSKNIALTDLNCFSNQIKDKAMTSLVIALPTIKKGEICVIDTKDANEGNICTKAEVAIAKDKGWRVTDLNGKWDDRKDYEGSEGNSVASINSDSLQIYPNPATDFVQIQGAKAEAVVRLYNLDGRLVLIAKTDADGIRLDVSTLAMGEYLLTVGSSYSQRISIVR